MPDIELKKLGVESLCIAGGWLEVVIPGIVEGSTDKESKSHSGDSSCVDGFIRVANLATMNVIDVLLSHLDEANEAADIP